MQISKSTSNRYPGDLFLEDGLTPTNKIFHLYMHTHTHARTHARVCVCVCVCVCVHVHFSLQNVMSF